MQGEGVTMKQITAEVGIVALNSAQMESRCVGMCVFFFVCGGGGGGGHRGRGLFGCAALSLLLVSAPFCC
jgi:hypothetical protein